MKAIYKYPISREDRQFIEMPKGAEVLTVDVQFGEPSIWVLVDTDQMFQDQMFQPMEKREFYLVGTGRPFTEKREDFDYVGTFQIGQPAGELVGHLFCRFRR